MSMERLVEEITDLVFRQLSGSGGACSPSVAPAEGVPVPCPWPGAPAPFPVGAPVAAWGTAPVAWSAISPAPSSPSRPMLLVAMAEGERGLESWWPRLRVAATTARVLVVPSATFPRGRVLASLGEGPVGHVEVLDAPPPAWDALVRECRVVVLPNAGLNTVSGLANLLAIEPAVGAALRGLIEARPVLVGSDEIDFLTFHASHLARPFVQGVREHAARAQALGARLMDVVALGQELASLARDEAGPGPVAAASRGRSVLTRDDVEMLVRSGHRVIEVPSGSIITSLAQEAALQAGVEIAVR